MSRRQDTSSQLNVYKTKLLDFILLLYLRIKIYNKSFFNEPEVINTDMRVEVYLSRHN